MPRGWMRVPFPSAAACLALALSLCAAFPCTSRADGDDEPEARPATERPRLRAGRLNGDLVLDGRLRENAWRDAPDSIPDLTMIEPEEGGTPTARTIVKVLADARDLVIGVRCFDPEPSKIVAFSKARDSQLDEEDHVVLVLDPFLDGRSGFVFAVNPAGARFDGLVAARGEETNSDWDAPWEARTSLDESGWCAEIRIPISSLPFRRGATEWGFNVQRRIQRLQETNRWSGAKLDYEVFQTSRAGVLAELPEFELGLGLSVRPAVVGDYRTPAPGQPSKTEDDMSLDVTQRLGPDVLTSLTVNTDFSETEVDVRRINLTRFPISFPEKRTFFLTGADVFEFSIGLDETTLLPFYSRRIGLVGSEEEDLAAMPIDVGGKLTGRLGSTNLGALVVNTRGVDGLRLTDTSAPIDIPDATMGAVRLKQDILAESAVGLLATFGDQMGRRRSWSAGMDLTYQTSEFLDEKNLLAGVWGMTNGREGLAGDRTAYGGMIDYPNDLLDLSVLLARIGDGFDPSLGFVPRRGVQVFAAAAEINPRPGWPLVRQLDHELSFTQVQNRLTGLWESYSVTVKPIGWLFESGDYAELSLEPEGDRPIEPFEVSPDIDIGPGSYEWSRTIYTLRSAERRRISGEVRRESGGYYTGSLRTNAVRLTLKPSSLFILEFTGERNRAMVWSPEDWPASTRLVERRFTQDLLGFRFEFNFSPDLQLSSLTQYDSETRDMGSNTRVRWTFNPAGDVFLVYNHNEIRRLDNRWRFESRQLPVKVQFAWRF